jgi:DNA-binding NarL/FixJ family response regulator
MPVRVLLADDSAVLRKALSQFLNEVTDIELVGVAQAVSEALAMLRSLEPDILLFDVHMAVRREDRCKDLKAVSRKLPLLAISIDADEEAQTLAERCGAARVIDKMNLDTELIPAIVQTVSRRSSGASSAAS